MSKPKLSFCKLTLITFFLYFLYNSLILTQTKHLPNDRQKSLPILLQVSRKRTKTENKQKTGAFHTKLWVKHYFSEMRQTSLQQFGTPTLQTNLFHAYQIRRKSQPTTKVENKIRPHKWSNFINSNLQNTAQQRGRPEALLQVPLILKKMDTGTLS